MDTNALARFERKVDRLPQGCWLWTAAMTSCGYGHMRIARAMVRAHRLAYEHFIGPIPSGMQLDHLCRNRLCVNPGHLEAVTSKENTRRGNGPAGVNALKTHCDNGHEFTPENTEWINTGRGRVGRCCVTCRSSRRTAA